MEVVAGQLASTLTDVSDRGGRGSLLKINVKNISPCFEVSKSRMKNDV